MSTMLDDNPGTIFTSSAGLLGHLELLWALSTSRRLQPEEGKVQMGADVGFPRGGGKLFVLKPCWSLSRFNASAHLKMIWEDLGVIS